MSLVFVDCEAYGGCPATGRLTEFGAVVYGTRESFHGVLLATRPSAVNPAVPEPVEDAAQGWAPGWTYADEQRRVFSAFDAWLAVHATGRAIMVSDNPAYDFQWINDGFWRALGRNPFGHSARRLSDFYAGLCGDFHKTQQWKRLRVTPHDHNPVHDALGNLEAFERLLKGER